MAISIFIRTKTEINLKTVLVLIDNFYPAFKGGGPIQSITNLILSLEHEFNFCVITSAYDLQSKDILPGIVPDTWINVLLPQSKKQTSVWYSERSKPGYKLFRRLLVEKKPDAVYLNGIFSYNLFLVPLLVIKYSHLKPRIIICPRGMLQKGAIADKSLKKKTYLKVLKVLGIVDEATWHATNAEEREDVFKHLPVNNGVIIAKNIPKKPLLKIDIPEKLPGELRLIYLSLLSSKKNLYFLLKIIGRIDEKITLDIYGPIKDKVYWEDCKTLIEKMHGKVNYLGDVLPAQVQNTFEKYDASILLTKGENFGHALYESLSVGRPIITSFFTPWNNLKNIQAGWNLDIDDIEGCVSALNEIINISQNQYENYCFGAYDLSKKYFNSLDVQKSYGMLFSV